MSKKTKFAISPTRQEDYPAWYQAVIKSAKLAENSPVRGCMIICPLGFAIWENIQQILDKEFKATGHENVYFPLLIPLSFMEKEAQHIEGFAKECAVVTHHRLKTDNNKLIPDGELEEPYVIRPTSETVIGQQFSKWIQSYRDLPLLINQWANVMRWEMRTRLFLRTSEFLWQEGHTAHASSQEAIAETEQMLDIYADFAENVLAIPVIKGVKTEDERFPGAEATYTIEAMMQDGKALQAGTSHFLGQNFSKSFNIEYTSKTGELEYAWTTSWGVSTRLIGGLIMTHSDDNGLVLPPKIAPTQIIILPIFRNEQDAETVLSYCDNVAEKLINIKFNDQPIRVKIDKRDINGGEKTWQHIKQGTPIRLEIGPRDVENNAVFMGRRDQEPRDKSSIPLDTLLNSAADILEEIQTNLFQRAKAFRDDNTHEITDFTQFKKHFSGNENKITGFIHCYSSLEPEINDMISPLKVSARCIPLDNVDLNNQICVFTGKPAKAKVIYSKAY